MKMIANTGLWSMESGYQSSVAAKIVDNWLNHPDRWIKYILSGDTMALAEEGAPIAYTVAYRIQPNTLMPDGSPKGRESYNVFGKWVPIDFHISEELSKRGFYAVRPRVINAGTMGMFPLRLVARDIESHMKKEFGYCCLTRSPQHLGEKTAFATSIEMYDVKNHDWSADEEQLSSMKRAFMRKYNDWVGDLFDLSFYAPDLVRLDSPDAKALETGYTATWRGSIADASEYSQYAGNRSGIPVTSVAAKQWGILYSIFGLVARGDIKPDRKDITRALQGTHPVVGVINAGDNIIIVNKDNQKEPLKNFVRMAILDETYTFLGWIPIQGAGATTWLPNPESAVKKFLLADSSIASVNRPFWADGWFRRSEYFAANPAAKEAINIMNVKAAKHFGWTIDDVAKRYHASPNVPLSEFTDNDRAFMMNPEYIHYRLEAEEVNPALLERVYKTYTQEQTQKLTSMIRR
jgi:hypothetical protein